MKVFYYLSFAFLASIHIAVTSDAVAAVYEFSDQGLDFEINDDDPFAPTISFSDSAIPTPTILTSSLSNDFLVGTTVIDQPFPDPPIVVNDFDRVTVAITSLSIAGLVATGGQSNSLAYAGPDTFAFESAFTEVATSILISGFWSVEGDTETIGGTFDLELQPEIDSMPSAIDVAQYPDAVFLDAGLSLVGIATTRFDVIIDGDPLRFAFNVNYADNGVWISNLPVPPALYLFGSSLLGLLGFSWRRQGKAKSAPAG